MIVFVLWTKSKPGTIFCLMFFFQRQDGNNLTFISTIFKLHLKKIFSVLFDIIFITVVSFEYDFTFFMISFEIHGALKLFSFQLFFFFFHYSPSSSGFVFLTVFFSFYLFSSISSTVILRFLWAYEGASL